MTAAGAGQATTGTFRPPTLISTGKYLPAGATSVGAVSVGTVAAVVVRDVVPSRSARGGAIEPLAGSLDASLKINPDDLLDRLLGTDLSILPDVNLVDIALAVKVGELQARILRLDAFGERLAKAAGIKPTEFRFDEKPGQGGPSPLAARAPPHT